MVQACLIKYLVACRHALTSSFLLFRVPDICKVFRNNGLKITIEANKKIVNFLDVTLNLDKGSYEPYTKPNNTPIYVHRESNHPHSILKSIPLAINKRLSEISSNKESFDKAARIYQ